MNSSIFNYCFLIFLLCVPFVPYFGTIDIIGAQWFYLSIGNLFFFLYNFSKNNYLYIFKSILTLTHFKLYLLFIFISLFSIFYSINWSVSIVDFSRILIVLFSIIHVLLVFRDPLFSLRRLSFLISIILLIEIFISFYPVIEFLRDNNFSEIDFSSLPNALKGVSGNKNVLAADIVFKSAFLFYSIISSKRFTRLFFMLSLLITSSLIILLSSRASYISFSFVLILFMSYIIFKRQFLKQFLYIILPLFFSYFIVSSLTSNETIISDRLSTIASPSTDTSTNQRLFLYENAIDFISNNPLVGCGLGNWKLRSLPYWKDKLSGYTIPYHAHNDFLELSAELGLLGGLPYFFIFILIFFKSFFSFFKTQNNILYVLIFALTSVYFIDAMLNFPFERALSQVNFVVLFSLSIFIFNDNEKTI